MLEGIERTVSKEDMNIGWELSIPLKDIPLLRFRARIQQYISCD